VSSGGVLPTMLLMALAGVLCVTANWPARAQSRRPLDVVLVLDNSGSMKQNDPGGLMPSAAADFARRLPADSSVGIVVFDQTATVGLPLTQLADATFNVGLERAVGLVNYRGRLTDISGGVERGLYELRQHGRAGAHGVVVLFTDGFVDLGDAQRTRSRTDWLLSDLVAQARRDQIPIFGIAFTEQADFELIQSLAQKTGGEHFRLLEAAHLRGVFEQVIERLGRVVDRPVPAPIDTGASTASPAARGRIPIGTALLVVAAVGALALVARSALARVGAPEVPATLQDTLDPTRMYSIDRRVYRIGSVRRFGFRWNDLVIPLETISRSHATIRHRDGGFVVEDEGSRNHTFVDGELVRPGQPRAISSGHVLRFDTREFRFGLPPGATRPRRANVPTQFAAEDESPSRLWRDTIPPRPSTSKQNRVDTQPPQGNKDGRDASHPADGPASDAAGHTENQCLDCDRHVAATELIVWQSFSVCRPCEAALQAISTKEAGAKRQQLAVKQQRRRPTVGTT
jgi:pSer/pThr/pTyr-binding forkhead associated (FHA) protein/Mg-chelatase subunit ChlD